ncbi:hypothetical protein E2C01_097557 [Portunus trituberculatus]|uniref:Uncharacterized protein n=1 Tax=Portunus trituberculatus TaxID=210409 RepID=A0A5B7K0Q1_PORTR|nr:hypothetical protein [Portunus trituberculatus]
MLLKTPSVISVALENSHGERIKHFLRFFCGSRGRSDKISTILTGETLLQTPLLISVALEKSQGETAERLNTDMRNTSTKFAKIIGLCHVD